MLSWKQCALPVFIHNGFVAAYALGHMMYGFWALGHILCLFCFCEIWTLCVLWITYGHLWPQYTYVLNYCDHLQILINSLLLKILRIFLFMFIAFFIVFLNNILFCKHLFWSWFWFSYLPVHFTRKR